MKADDERGELVGAFIVVEGDEVLCIKESGQVTRSAIDESLRATGRDTKGVKFGGVTASDRVAVVARSVERAPEIEEAAEEAADAAESADSADGATIDEGASAPSAGSTPEDDASQSPTDRNVDSDTEES
jgi:DNA gyrase subunit A